MQGAIIGRLIELAAALEGGNAGDHHINRGVRGAQPGAGTHFFHRRLADQLGGHQLHHALAGGFGLGEIRIPLAQVTDGAIDGLQQIGLADGALAHLGHRTGRRAAAQRIIHAGDGKGH